MAERLPPWCLGMVLTFAAVATCHQPHPVFAVGSASPQKTFPQLVSQFMEVDEAEFGSESVRLTGAADSPLRTPHWTDGESNFAAFGGRVVLANRRNGRLLFQWRLPRECWALAWDSSHRRGLCLGGESSPLRISTLDGSASIPSAEAQCTLPAPLSHIPTASIPPDLAAVFVSTTDGWVRCSATASGEAVDAARVPPPPPTTAKPARPRGGNAPDRIAFGPDGQQVAVGAWPEIVVFDLRTGRVSRVLRSHSVTNQPGITPYPRTGSLVWTDHPQMISVGPLDNPASQRWSLDQDQPGVALQIEDCSPMGVGNTVRGPVVFCEQEPFLRHSSASLGNPEVQVNEVQLPSLSSTGQALAGADASGAIALWTASPSGAFLRHPRLRWTRSGRLLGKEDPDRGVQTWWRPPCLSADGEHLAWASEREILVVETKHGSVLGRTAADRPWQVAFDTEGARVAWVTQSATSAVFTSWNWASDERWALALPVRTSTAPAFARGGRWAGIGTLEGVVVVDTVERTWRLLRRVVIDGTVKGVEVDGRGRVRGDPLALEHSWFRVSTDILAPLLRGTELMDSP